MNLKPCPFCGSEPELNYGHISIPSGEIESVAYVVCHTCGARTGNHHGMKDAAAKSGAVHAWNMREVHSHE